ncbi:hypothetical protein EST38_g1660 [Candolleomyces aberdarensis]|uniref:DUF6593 domain-containing protein n=1 Tax=Candolleomyces aberdarensis TaxID=2316362 RepID=A0A4Q2DY28_9AGAR|nr:hypothetical protein EST38_g1660 [Candolleomyces aberdarensis]
MDLVFLYKNLLDTPVTDVDSNIAYEIRTTRPSGSLIPVTRISRVKGLSVTMPGRGPKRFILQEKLAEIHWKGISTPTRVHSPFLGEDTVEKGVEPHTFLKRRNPLSLSQRCFFFVGNDGIKYRWKTIETLGAILTRDGEEVARCTRRTVGDGMFLGETKFVLRIQPGFETLDVGMMILTFLIVDHKRHQKEIGPLNRWATIHDEDPGEAEASGEGEHGQSEGG